MGIAAYYRNPRPDLAPALKILWHSKKPGLSIARYFATLAAYKIPALAKRLERKPVDFSQYMPAYDKTTASYHPYREAMARIVSLLDLKGGEQVVDLCSGTGNLSLAVKAGGGQPVSLDYCNEPQALHRTKDPTARAVKIDLKNGVLPLADRTADRVCGANAWTYFNEPERQALYREIKRVLKPGGLFVLGVEAEGYSPARILKYHLAKEYRNYRSAGDQFLTALAKTYSGFIANYRELLITARESLKLMRKIAQGEYQVFTEALIRAEVEKSGFQVLALERNYAGQVILIKAAPLTS